MQDMDDGPPPLEDMVEQVQALKQKREPIRERVERVKQAASQSKPVLSLHSTAPALTSLLLHQPHHPPPQQESKEQLTDAVDDKRVVKRQEDGCGGMFGGMKGGFFANHTRGKPAAAGAAKASPSAPSSLSSSSSSFSSAPGAVSRTSTSAASSNTSSRTKAYIEEIVDGAEDEKEQDMPFIRPSAANQHSSLRFDEVQQAVQGAAAISQSHSAQDVNNPDFLSKLQSQPELLQGLANPRVSAAIADMQKDPKAAMRKYANDKEVTTFILAFMRLMGDHMEELGAEEKSKHRAEQEKRKAEQNKPRQADPAQVQRWMSDPTIRAVLNDPSTSQLLSAIQADRSLFNKYAGDRRIAVLVRAGILDAPPDYRLP